MGTPSCHRCGTHSYSGEVTIDTRTDGGTQRTSKTYSLCGYCFPIVFAKLHGFMDDHLTGVTRISNLPTGDFRDGEDRHNVFEMKDKGAS